MPVTIKTNFARRAGSLVPVLAVATWGTVLAALIGAGTLFGMRAQLHNSLPALRAQLNKLQAHHASLAKKKTKMPSHADLVALQRRVSVINKIVESKSRSISELLMRLEGLLPRQAWLVSLHQRRTRGEVEIVAASKDVGTLTQFLKKLENDSYFADALLTQQSHGRGKRKNNVQFEIRLMERVP